MTSIGYMVNEKFRRPFRATIGQFADSFAERSPVIGPRRADPGTNSTGPFGGNWQLDRE